MYFPVAPGRGEAEQVLRVQFVGNSSERGAEILRETLSSGGGTVLAPALRLNAFNFTSATSH